MKVAAIQNAVQGHPVIYDKEKSHYIDITGLFSRGCVCALCLAFCDPVDCCPPGSFCPLDFPDKNTWSKLLLSYSRGPRDSGDLNFCFPVSPELVLDSLPLSHLGIEFRQRARTSAISIRCE